MTDAGRIVVIALAGIICGIVIRIIIDAILASWHREISGDWEGYRKRNEELEKIGESNVAAAKQKKPLLPHGMTYEQIKKHHLLRCKKTGYIDELEIGKPCENTLEEQADYIIHKIGNVLGDVSDIQKLLRRTKEEE